MNSNQSDDQDADGVSVMVSAKLEIFVVTVIVGFACLLLMQVVIKMTLSISGFVLNVISLVLLSLTLISYVAIR